jgi:replicative DNA helicase
MSPANVTHRMIQSRTGMSVPVIMNPKQTTQENRSTLESVVDHELSENRKSLFYLRPGLITPQDILAAGRAIQVKSGALGLVVVDYLQLMHCPERGMNSQERVAWLSRNMKATALQLDVPIMVLSQLNRGQVRDGREPELYDLRDSGAIEQDADIVVFTHRPSQESNEAHLLVKKQRYGITGKVRVAFDPARCRFVTVERAY